MEHVREALKDSVLMADLPSLVHSMLLRGLDLLVRDVWLEGHL